MTKTTPAPTEAEKFLEELKQETLRKEWTPERSELVDIIDEVQDAKVYFLVLNMYNV